MIKELNPIQTKMFDTLYEKYGTMSLSKKQASEAMNVSTATLDLDRKAGRGCAYKQETAVSNVYYPLTAVVEYLTTNLVGGA